MNGWIAAIAGQLLNGVVFLIDKLLLSIALKRSATYAILTGLASGLVMVAIPWVRVWPHGSVLLASIVCGVTFVSALWAFYETISRSEASRAVPMVAALIPIVTLFGEWAFLSMQISLQSLFGLALLVGATVLLIPSSKTNQAKRGMAAYAVLAAFFFAITSVSAAITYRSVGVLSGIVSTRMVVFVAAGVLFFVETKAKKEILEMRSKRVAGASLGRFAIIATIFGQICGAFGFLLIQFALVTHPPSIVNALQAIQFVFLFIAGFFLSKKYANIFQESLSREILIRKGAATLCVALGLSLIL